MFTEKLQPGDKVLVASHRGDVRPGTVERLTKTLVVVNGAKFRKRDGREQGSDYYNAVILPFCQDTLDAQKRDNVKRAQRYAVRATRWQDVSSKKIARIAAILSED